jgi:hypothetical protein
VREPPDPYLAVDPVDAHPEIPSDLVGLPQPRSRLTTIEHRMTGTVSRRSAVHVDRAHDGRYAQNSKFAKDTERSADRGRTDHDAAAQPLGLSSCDWDVAALEDSVQLEGPAERLDVTANRRELGVLGALDPRDVLLADA